MKTATAKHTPLPWKIDTEWNGDIQGPDGKDVCVVAIASLPNGEAHARPDAEVEANAEFIVRAVNAHEELLETAKALHQTFGKRHIGYEKCRFCKAIAKAEGR